MKGVQELGTMPEVIWTFWGDFENKFSLIFQAGKLLAEARGKNTTAEYFLRGFLVAYLSSGDSIGSDVETCLTRATADLREEKEIRCRVNEILEICFAYLTVFGARMQIDTRWALEAVEANPPHLDFLHMVHEKIVASRMEGMEAAA